MDDEICPNLALNFSPTSAYVILNSLAISRPSRSQTWQKQVINFIHAGIVFWELNNRIKHFVKKDDIKTKY